MTMGVDVTEIVRMVVDERLRAEREYGAQMIQGLQIDALRADVQRLADALATLLPTPPGVEEVSSEEADELQGEALDDTLVDPAAVIIDDLPLDDDELEVVEELTPQEAADEIAPLRTHPLLYDVGRLFRAM